MSLMSMFDRFRRGGRQVVVYVGGRSRDAVLGMSLGKVYRTQPELQAVVSFLASSVAQLPLKCYLRESDGDRPRDTEGVLPTLLAAPGGGVTTYELVLSTVSDICLYGHALWYVMPSAEAASGFELRDIPAAWVSSIKTADGFSPSSYVIDNPDTDSPPVAADAASFVRFVTYNPGHPTVPLSPVEGLRQVLAERASSREYRSKVWSNGGWFSRYIERPATEAEWGTEARRRFAASMKHHFSGGEGTDSGGIPILEDGMRFVESAINAKEAEWAESMRLTREDVAAAYHVDPSIVWSSDGQTYASVRESARSLYADTLGPLLRLVQDGITSKLVPMIGADPKSYAEFDITAKLAGSFEEQASVLSTSTGGPWMTRNEARARQNLPAVEGGDELIVPMNVTEGGLASPTDTDPTRAYSARPMAKALPCPPGRRHGVGSPRLKTRPREGDVERVEEVLEAFYRRQGASLADRVLRMDAADIVLDADADWLDVPRWTDELCDDLFDAVSRFAPRVARMAAGGVGGDPEGLDEDAVDAEVRRLSRFQASDIVRSTLDQTVRELRQLGELTPESARDCVLASYGRLMESRIRRNGGGVTAAATNAATVTGVSHVTSDALKEWRCAGHNSRKSHIAMNGERAPVDGTFSNGARWPGDPSLPPHESCGCGCHVEIVRGRDRAKGRHVARARARARDADRAMASAWRAFKRDEREESYQATVGAYIRSFSETGEISARFRAKPKGKELQTAKTIAGFGHTIEFLSDVGRGSHPDALVDGVLADFKRVEAFDPDRVYKLARQAAEQGASMAIIDLALDSVTLADAQKKAAKVIAQGFLEAGKIILIDWHGAEHIV